MKRLFTLLTVIFLSLLLTPCSALAQGPQPDPRFGIVETYVDSAAATQAGAGYTRIILRWDVIQPAGRDDWKPANVPDPFIEAELAAGRQVVAVLIGTPAWAAKGADNSRAVPDMEAWGNFTTRIAQQYQGRINHWIIWNEPDVWDLDHQGSTWLGTEAEYVELLKVAYNNIKTVDPTMQVLLTGLTYHWDAQHNREQYLSRILKIITADPEAANRNYYFDAVVYHLYFKPAQMFDILTQVRGILDSFGLAGKPIWVNETNAPPSDDPLEPAKPSPRFIVSTAEQANFIIQAYALLIAAGAERIEIYKMRNSLDHPEDIEPFGLVRSDGTRRPAFDAYRVVTSYFGGYSKATWVLQGNVYIITLDRGGQTTTVLWNTSRQDLPFTLNAIAAQATLVDQTGAEQPLAAVNGTYTLVLPGATCTAGDCFIGGAPRLLVEAGSPEQRASLVPLATSTPTPTPLPTATPTPAPTATPPATATPAVTAPAPAITPSAEAVAVAPANQPTPRSSLQAEVSPAAPPKAEFSLAAIFTPRRLILLVVLGVVLFTVIFFVQFRLWSRWRL